MSVNFLSNRWHIKSMEYIEKILFSRVIQNRLVRDLFTSFIDVIRNNFIKILLVLNSIYAEIVTDVHLEYH